LTAHLVRQYVAGSLFALGFCLWAHQRGKLGLAAILTAVTVHSAAAALLVPLAMAMLARRSLRLYAGGLLALSLVFLSGYFANTLDLASQLAYQREDGMQGPLLMALDGGVLMAALAVQALAPPVDAARRLALRSLLAFAFAQGLVLYFLHDVPFLFFRLYMFVEFTRAALLAVLVHAGLLRAGALRPAAALLLIAVAAATCWTRAATSGWSYLPAESGPTAYTMPGIADRWSRIESQ
jgi:hypothetical protein